MLLKGKTILFIAPKFFGYHELIIKCLERLGARVVFFSERETGILNSIKTALKIPTDKTKWQKKIQTKIAGVSIDYLFVIKGQNVTLDFIDFFKKENPDAKLLMYQWDSIVNHDFTPLIDQFDQTFSFDPIDAKINGLKYLPLFYHYGVQSIANNKNHEDIDLLLIGSYLPERYEALQALISYARDHKLVFYHHLFVPRSYYYQLIGKGVNISKHLIKFNSVKSKELMSLYARSKAFVDVSSINQSGFSMRAVECLGAKKKLITNNKNILDSNLYSEKQIIYFDPQNLNITRGFLNSEVTTMPAIHDLYIDNWVNTLFDSLN